MSALTAPTSMALVAPVEEPSTASKPASRVAKKDRQDLDLTARHTYSPNFDRLSIKRLREIEDAAAGVHRGAWRSGGVPGAGAGAAVGDAGDRVSQPPIR